MTAADAHAVGLRDLRHHTSEVLARVRHGETIDVTGDGGRGTLVSLYYADTSAVIKLLIEETHSKAFAAYYDTHADAEWVSSALLRIEVTRAVARAMPMLLPEASD